MTELRIRPAICADNRWYPAAADDLRREVSGHIERAERLANVGDVLGLIAPHAGYFFSAHVAGAGYRQVRDAGFDTVVLVGPDHTGAAMGETALPDFDVWRTPLGDVRVDRGLAAALEQHCALRSIRRDQEHSLEVQLPFLQVALQDFTLLPLMMGSQSAHACCELGLALAGIVRDRRALFVASTDLSHYQPDAVARELDQHTLQYVLDFDPDGLVQALEHSAAHACGGGPVAVVMYAARELGATDARLMKYATSGDVWADRAQVVGYASVVLTKPPQGVIA
jgi:AmmeMemoRadiSam system protein B